MTSKQLKQPVVDATAGIDRGARRGGGLLPEDFLHILKPLAKGIAQTFGERCEVVIHDFADPEHSIVAIEGNVTGRKVGGSVSEIGLAAIRGGDSQEDIIGYVQNSKDGRVIRSSTIMLKDGNGQVRGCFCINFDVTDLVALRGAISSFLPGLNGDAEPVHFSSQIDEVLAGILRTVTERIPTPPALMGREARLAFVAELDQAGAFSVQRAVPTIAEYLGVSRTTIYTYLEDIRLERKNGQR